LCTYVGFVSSYRGWLDPIHPECNTGMSGEINIMSKSKSKMVSAENTTQNTNTKPEPKQWLRFLKHNVEPGDSHQG
jgi:hypothetical protein